MGSSWDTTSGLMDGRMEEVTAAWFGENEESERAGDKLYLHLQGNLYEEGADVPVEDHILRLSIGSGFEVYEEGAEVEHGSGKNQFNRNTGIGRFIDSIKALDNADEVFAYLGERGEATQATTFEGLSFTYENVNFPFTNDDGENVDYYVPQITEFEVPGAKKTRGKAKSTTRKSTTKKSTTRKKAPAKKAPAKKSRAKKSDEDVLKDKLVELAGEFEDHEEFVEAALEEFPEVEEFDDLHVDLMDEDGEIWTTAGE